MGRPVIWPSAGRGGRFAQQLQPVGIDHLVGVELQRDHPDLIAGKPAHIFAIDQTRGRNNGLTRGRHGLCPPISDQDGLVRGQADVLFGAICIQNAFGNADDMRGFDHRNLYHPYIACTIAGDHPVARGDVFNRNRPHQRQHRGPCRHRAARHFMRCPDTARPGAKSHFDHGRLPCLSLPRRQCLLFFKQNTSKERQARGNVGSSRVNKDLMWQPCHAPCCEKILAQGRVVHGKGHIFLSHMAWPFVRRARNFRASLHRPIAAGRDVLGNSRVWRNWQTHRI